jgi:hypothetical protein
MQDEIEVFFVRGAPNNQHMYSPVRAGGMPLADAP